MEYTLIRDNGKKMRMSVTRQGELVVRAPYNVPTAKIDAFVERHKRWAANRQARHTAHPVPDFSDGSTVEIGGRQYTVQTGRAMLSNDVLSLPREDREAYLVAILKKYAYARMRVLVVSLCKQYGFSCEGVTITSARGRWGSCNGKKVNFTFRSAFLPDHLARYLAVHELCHTREMNHSPRFWNEVARILPDHAALRKELRSEYQWAMNCL